MHATELNCLRFLNKIMSLKEVLAILIAVLAIITAVLSVIASFL